MNTARLRIHLALFLLVAIVSSGSAFAEEFTWNPQARSISGLLKTPETRIDLADFSPHEAGTIIETSIRQTKKRKRELKELIQDEYNPELERLEAVPALGADPSEEDIAAAAAREIRKAQLIELRDRAKEERDSLEPILAHLAGMKLILGSPPLAELYKEFHRELHSRYEDHRNAGDGIKHLALFLGYREYLENTMQYALDPNGHKVEFQNYLKARSKVDDVSYLPHKFMDDVFIGDEASTNTMENARQVERAMQWTAWPTLWKCGVGLLTAAALTHYIAGNPHDRAENDLKPYGQHQVDGRHKENPTDGEAEATNMMERAAKDMQKQLIGK